MLDDEQILERGWDEEDIANYAHDVWGACGAIYWWTCDHCWKTDEEPWIIKPLTQKEASGR